MERIGIYGGTYNPPHLGHMRAAQAAIEALRLDRLLLIPTAVSPHKQLPDGSANPQQRLQMLQLSADGMEKASVSDIELRREGKSYTVDTVLQLRRQHPDARLFLLMGTDMFLSFLSWYQPRTILETCAIGVFYRGDRGEEDAVARQKEALEAMGAEIYLVQNRVTDISSTELRRMLLLGCADSFLSAGVGDYIRANGLYGTGGSLKQLPLPELEQAAVKLLKENRIPHVLGCRDTAVALARRWGEDEQAAARAALLHDCTKALDGPLQLTLCGEYGIFLDKFSREHSKTLHAYTGSLVAERIFGESEAVVSAIRWHTTGKADMTVLEKIVYLADAIEPTRDYPSVARLRQLAQQDLDQAVLLCMERTVEYVRRNGGSLDPRTEEALCFLRNQMNSKP